jgi:hypothetical protein
VNNVASRDKVDAADPKHLQRYSFGLKTSDQIICRQVARIARRKARWCPTTLVGWP